MSFSHAFIMREWFLNKGSYNGISPFLDESKYPVLLFCDFLKDLRLAPRKMPWN